VVSASILQKLILSSVVCWLGASLVSRAQAAASPRTYLSGGELAARLLQNVALIDVEKNEKGTGFVIGVDDNHLYIVTALHVLTGESDTATAEGQPVPFSIEFCSNRGISYAVSTDNVVQMDRPKDIAVFRIPKIPNYSPRLEATATSKPMAPNRIWSVGKDGDCIISDIASVEVVEDVSRNLIIAHGGFGGTSGSPALSGEGIVGMVWSTSNGVNVSALSIDYIREFVSAQSVVPWSLVASNNVPPLSREAAAWDLTTALNDYVLNLMNVRDGLVEKTYRIPEFEGVVDRYNSAISAFNAVKDRHDGTLVQHWGNDALDAYSAVRARVEGIHAVIYRFNPWMSQLREADVVPPPIRRRMIKASPQVEQLDAAVKNFLVLLKQQPT
jgi:hypothetical protein